MALDNGQHLLIGAYRQTLDLVKAVHGAERVDSLFRRLPLTLRPFGSQGPRCGRAPGMERARPVASRRRNARCPRADGGRAHRACRWTTGASQLPGSVANRGRRSRNALPERPSAHSRRSGRRFASPPSTRRPAPHRRRCSPKSFVPRSRVPRATATSSFRRSTSPRVFLTPRQAASSNAAASFAGESPCTRSLAAAAASHWRSAEALKRSVRRSWRSARISSPRRWAWTAPATPHGEPRSHRSTRSPTNRSRRSTLPLRHAFRSRHHCCASTTRPAIGRSTAARRSIAGVRAPKGLVAVVISAGGPHDACDHPTLAQRRRSAAAPACPRSCLR